MEAAQLPNLDYAMLAEFATVKGGALTIVGASFTRISVTQIPGPLMLSVCGRIRCHLDLDDPVIGVRFGPESGEYAVALDIPTVRDASTAAYRDGRFGMLFAANLQTVVTQQGLHEVAILLNGEPVRSLRFDVVGE